MSIEKAFNNSIEYYDDWMKKALPDYVTIFRTAQNLVHFSRKKPIDVLDLGAGTGLFSKIIFEKYLHANFILYDLAAQMLEVAEDRFRKNRDQFEFITDDYRHIEGVEKFDLVISSLSIHHLTHEDKRELFRKIHKILRNQGLFINIDQIHGGTNYLRKLYWDQWLDHVHKAGAPEKQIRDSIDRRKKYDKDATMEEQLRWLKEAGFGKVDCVYKNYFIGIFLGQR